MARQSVKPNQGRSRGTIASVSAFDRPTTFRKMVILVAALVSLHQVSAFAEVLTGQSAFTDYTKQSPGVRRKLTVADLPAPFATLSADSPSRVVGRPVNAWPQGPPGFKVTLYASGLDNPRLIRTAPNGDLFLAESQSGKIRVFRGVAANGHAAESYVFATGLRLPFGISFYPNGPDPKWVYVGNTDSVVRFPYQNGDTQARGQAQLLAELPGGAGILRGRGHWTRDVVFSRDGKRMFVSVGSYSNVDDPDTHARETRRAAILEFTPEGHFVKVYASGVRNAVGLAINPDTGQLWASVNERDELGDDLPPDYITHIQEDGFYGWPWYYMGGIQDPRHPGKHPELKDKVIVPDVLLQPHYASLEMTFYDGSQFPSEYHGYAFASEHGSWNRRKRTGYQVICVPMHNGKADGSWEDFLTGFVTPDGKVWGRPVGVAVAKDGSLFVSDDGSNSIWLVRYTR